jgi:hypothetical protein
LRLQLRQLEGGFPATPSKLRIRRPRARWPMRTVRVCDRPARLPIFGWNIKRITGRSALRYGLHTPVANG